MKRPASYEDSVPISVLIATYHRPVLLERTLKSIFESDLRQEAVQLIVVDNADDAETARICGALQRRGPANLTLIRLVEGKPGKNAALNRGLEQAAGDLILFTDDDVLVDPGWVRSMAAAARRWPQHVYFGGRVLPAWPGEPPAWLRESRYLSVCFTAMDRDDPEGPIATFVPFGPNMAVRRAVFDEGVRYDDAVGPTPESSYVMGSEAELTRRLKARGHQPVYVPKSVVHHIVRPEQLRLRWLMGRSVRYGRSVAHKAIQEGRATPGRAPAHLARESLEAAVSAAANLFRGRRQEAFDRIMDAGAAFGRIKQLREA